MGLFTSEYKEDALKWRAQKDENRRREVDRKFKMTVEIGLKDGDTQYKTIERVGRLRDLGFLDPHWVAETGEMRLKGVYEDIKKTAGTEGLEDDNGIFYPHSAIAYIKNLGIEEVTE